MCGNGAHAHSHLRRSGVDEFVLDTPTVRSFIASARAAIDTATTSKDAIAAIKPSFAQLLADPDWLPAQYQCDAANSGMGGGIGQYLLFRAGSGDLSLFALVVPPGASTPVHDHLAWGLIGLYRGEQAETVFARRDDGAPVGDVEPLTPTLRRQVKAGDFYPLLPPNDDIHQVTTTSAITSVSIHLLAGDTGCIWRHRYDPTTGEVAPFRSGYVNWQCQADAAD